MANQVATSKPKFSVAIRTEGYQKLINDTLGDAAIAKQFVADITTVVSQNYALAKCDAASILSAGLVAQTLKLPLSPTLGFAYVIPYGEKAQFQIGWKGLVQLAQRTGLYSTIGVRAVHEGEYTGQDEFGEDLFRFSHEFDSKPIVGYYAYFKLTNGFKKTIYWTKEQCDAHAHKYSSAYGNKTGRKDNWKEMFDEMSMKTVLKQLISKWGPQSVEIQKAVTYDQATINKDGSYDYVDNDSDVAEEAPKTNVSNTIPKVNPDGVVEE